MRASVSIRSSSAWKMVTFRACADQLSRNLTNILQLVEAFKGLSLDQGLIEHIIQRKIYPRQEYIQVSRPLLLRRFRTVQWQRCLQNSTGYTGSVKYKNTNQQYHIRPNDPVKFCCNCHLVVVWVKYLVIKSLKLYRK